MSDEPKNPSATSRRNGPPDAPADGSPCETCGDSHPDKPWAHRICDCPKEPGPHYRIAHASDPTCGACNGSRLERIYGGHGDEKVVQCSMCAPVSDPKCLLEFAADGEAIPVDRPCPDNPWCEWPAGPCMKSYRPGTELYAIREEHAKKKGTT